MCEQAARYCRDGVHKLLNKEQAKLRAQESREQPKPVAGQDSESATAAQSGNSGAQPGGIDGLVRWIVTKMSDNKNISSREYASSKEEVAVAQEQFFAPEPRRGISVILDVSMEIHRGWQVLEGWVLGMKTSSEQCVRTGAVRTYAQILVAPSSSSEQAGRRAPYMHFEKCASPNPGACTRSAQVSRLIRQKHQYVFIASY